MRIATSLLTAALATFGLVHVAAADATSNLGVSATVSNSCVIAANAVGFGPYNIMTPGPAFGVGSVDVACNQGTETAIQLGQGFTPGVGSTEFFPQREMQGPGGSRLAYGLFQDPGHAQQWGNEPGSGFIYFAVDASVVNIPVFGQIQPGQSANAGLHTDSVVATILF